MNKIANLLNRVLNSNGTKLKKQNEYMYWSPFISHHKPKLQINITTGKWHCWVSNQGGHNLFQLFKKVGASNEHFSELGELVDDVPRYKKTTDTSVEVVQLPKEYKPLWNGGDSIVKRHALNYLYKRGITDEDILKYDIGYCDNGLYSNRIIIPSYDSDGKLNFFVGRDFYSSKMKYRNSPTSKDIVGFDLFINWEEPIILCEGVFDAMAFKRNAIPLFGKTVMNKLMKKIIESRVKTIYLALDNDAISDAVKISENFINNGIEVKMMNFEEKDPSETGFEKLLYLINRTSKTKFSDLMRVKLNGKTRKHMEIQ
jgi:DNA primase